MNKLISENILDQLNQEHFHIICFGDKVYTATKSWLTREKKLNKNILTCGSENPRYNVTLYKVMHYSFRYGDNYFGEQLEELNRLID